MSFPVSGDGIETVIERETAKYGTIGGHAMDAETLIDMLEIDPNRPGHYTCNRFDRATMSCTRYDERPDMCRRYPYGRPCEHCHLTPDGALMLPP